MNEVETKAIELRSRLDELEASAPRSKAVQQALTGAMVGSVTIGSLSGVAGAESHTVREGEVAGQIAEDHGISLQILQDANLRDVGNHPDMILKGADLYIPEGSSASGGEYDVKPKDTFWSIAEQKLGEGATGPEVLALTNELVSLNPDVLPENLKPGQKIITSKDKAQTSTVELKAGDSPYSVAKAKMPLASEVEVLLFSEAIAETNGIKVVNGKAIVAEGETLVIPKAPAQSESSKVVAVEKAETSVAQPAEVKAASAPEPKPKQEVVVEKSIKINYDSIQGIPEKGISAEQVREAVRYMVESHDLTFEAAADLTGNIATETGFDMTARGDNGSARGAFQWRNERQEGMPTSDNIFDYIDFAIEVEMPRHYNGKHLVPVIRDENASTADRREKIYDWILWGHEGERFEYADRIIQQGLQPIESEQKPAAVEEKQPSEEDIAAYIAGVEAGEAKKAAEIQALGAEKAEIKQKYGLDHSLIDVNSITPGVKGKGIKGQEQMISTVNIEGRAVNAEIALNVAKLMEHARNDGVNLTITDGHRSYEEQEVLRGKNDCADTYFASASSCRVPTARPGESNHQDGKAIDFGESHDSLTNIGFNWLSQHAADYGLKNLPSESWHWSVNGG